MAYEDQKIISGKKKHTTSFVGHLFKFALEHPNLFDFQIAQTFEEVLNAYHLVYQEYLACGYSQPKRSQIHYTYFCLLPDSRTFLLLEKENRQILGTVSLILDSSCGLPIESLFDRELHSVRKEGRRLAEVTLLSIPTATNEDEIFQAKNVGKFLAVFSFFRALFQYARNSGVTDLVIAVNPRHEAIYKYLTFESIGPVRAYPEACGNPARPMHLDMVQFCNPKFQNDAIQKYFLAESELPDSHSRPAHWNSETVAKLFLIAPSLREDLRSIFETYLMSCPSPFGEK